ncbi:helix-turn-helix transcriptional regulator [Erwinia sorbitola]|uniref:Arabinose operon regulatory protein n=1 Tax=Erwinia sorbitola TaxID=2681984 RepID=A0A6I6EWN9_9GAMM|nr:AraC family transcriptional regulator [Erwinia sorbitola]MTD27201.1 helix-turn-helix domain-containing protein [Erwinia sorbitola]QGU88753.1 helix-turn-helix domain-containing protein [Erwinia sorbitola]
MVEDERLELIALKDSIVSFSRLFANPVRYHHWHQCLEVLYVEEGYGVVMVGNKQYTMRPGRLFIFPPFTIHKIMVEEGARDCYRRTIIHVDHHAVLNILKEFPQNQHQLQQLSQRGSDAVVLDAANIHQHIDHLFSSYAARAAGGALSAEHVACLLLSLFGMLPENPPAVSADTSRLSTLVLFWIEDHYMEKFSLARLAAALERSKSYVSRRFQVETGEMIHDYLTTFRLRKSCELLMQTSHSIQQIALMVGFAEVTYFISTFRKGMGETPLQYRKNHG